MGKFVVFLFIACLCLPTICFAQNPHMKYVAVKKTESGRTFVYKCSSSGYSVEVEQRYNNYAKSEEIRFVVNQTPGEWITDGISPDIYIFLARDACEKSTHSLNLALAE